MRLTSAQQYGACVICSGTGKWSGLFHKGACVACNGVGVVLQSGEALSLEQGVEYLRDQLAAAREGRPAKKAIAGDAEHYQQTNTRGPGGSHYSGD